MTAKPVFGRRLRWTILIVGWFLIVWAGVSFVGELLAGSPAYAVGAIALLGAPGALLLLLARRMRLGVRRVDTRRRFLPPLPRRTRVERIDHSLDPESLPLPLFDRAGAELWTQVVVVRQRGRELRVFRMTHRDVFGEAAWEPRPTALRTPPLQPPITLTCAVAEVEAELPVVAVWARTSRPVVMPDGLHEYSTEHERFNRSYQLLASDRFAANAIVDARTMDAIANLDPRFSVEIGGRWVMVFAPMLDRAGTARLIRETARLMEVFPAVVRSLYPRPSGMGTRPDSNARG